MHTQLTNQMRGNYDAVANVDLERWNDVLDRLKTHAFRCEKTKGTENPQSND